jgi:hypothetical protein
VLSSPVWEYSAPGQKNSVLPRWSTGRRGDYEGVTHPQVRPDPALGLLKLYDDALPHVYGYLLARVDDQGVTFRLWQPAG